MLNTFTDAFGTDGDNSNKTSSSNPFDLPLSGTIDPFGISTNMKLSESSEKFDDNPFNFDTNKDATVRPRSGKEALSSSNWLAYQHSMDEANFDLLENDKGKSLVTESTSVNPMNPFLNTTSTTNQAALQSSSIDLLFDINVDQNTTLQTGSNQVSTNPFLNHSSNDQNKTSKSLSETQLGNNIDNIFSSPLSTKPIHSTEIKDSTCNTALLDLLPAKANTNTNTTSNSTYNDQLLDWLITSDNTISNQNSKINDKNINQNLFESIQSKPSMFYKYFSYFLFLD